IVNLGFQRQPAELQKLADLQWLERLEWIHLFGRNIDDRLLSNSSGAPIKRLTINATEITDRVADDATGLPNLTELSLVNNPKTTAALFERLPQLTNITDLSLGEISLTDVGLTHIAKMSKLRHLRVSAGAISRDGLRTAASLRGLVTLTFDGAGMGD